MTKEVTVRKVLAITTAALFFLGIVGSASGRGPANEFAVGSGKADAFAGLERISVSAHNIGIGCLATGSVVYETPVMKLKVDVDVLVIDPVYQGRAFIGGEVKSATDANGNPIDTLPVAHFDVFDSGMQPDGTGDLFQFSGFHTLEVCFVPLVPTQAVTRGNIVVKATALLP